MPRRELRWAIAAGLAAICLAACGGGSGVPGAATIAAATHRPQAAPASQPPSGAAPVPAPSGSSDRRSPQLRHLQAVIQRVLAPEGPHVGVLVQDVDTHQVLYSHAAGVPRPPASVEKLYTSVAVLSMLGPQATLETKVLGVGTLGPGGVWHGDLYLRGGGDPTFGDGTFNRLYEDGYGPTAAQLVAQLRHAGITRVAGYLIADESIFDTDRGGPATADHPDVPDYGGQLSALVYDHGATEHGFTPATFAASEVALTARSEGIGLFASGASGVAPPGAQLLASVSSPPVSTLVRLMDVPSDDLFADLLAKQLGYRFFGRGTLAAGAIEISQDIAEHFRLEPTILDGSGLDKSDRSSPAQIVSLLRQLTGTPVGGELEAALPVVGETGTVQGIAVHTAAQGHCEAKTGTLNDVSNLAGWCTATGGQTLAFAVMIDGPSNWQAFAALSKVVAAIAAY